MLDVGVQLHNLSNVVVVKCGFRLEALDESETAYITYKDSQVALFPVDHAQVRHLRILVPIGVTY